MRVLRASGRGKEESRWRGGFRRLVLAPRGLTGLAQPICKIWHKIVSAVLRELFQLCFSPRGLFAISLILSAMSI
jgi:hypothetical protein